MKDFRFHGSVIIAMAVALLAGSCQQKKQDTKAQQLDIRATVSRHLSLIEGMPAKIGEPHWDQHAAAIISQGRNASPYLIESLTNATPSKMVDGFQYALGDLAHRLLCELYGKPFIWPVAEIEQPVGGHPAPTFQDYLALVDSPNGRQKLQLLWRESLTK